MSSVVPVGGPAEVVLIECREVEILVVGTSVIVVENMFGVVFDWNKRVPLEVEFEFALVEEDVCVTTDALVTADDGKTRI